MKNIIKQILTFVLVVSIILNTFFSITVCASDIPEIDFPDFPVGSNDWLKEYEWVDEIVPDDKSDIELIMKDPAHFASYLLSNVGAILNGDFKQIVANENYWRDSISTKKIRVFRKKSNPEKKAIWFDKSVSDGLLDIVKEATKEPDNGGYELIKTIPASKISSLYFSSPARYTTFKNLLKDNGGMIGLQVYSGYKNCYYKVPSNLFWVGTKDWKVSDSNGTHEFYRITGYENTLSNPFNGICYDISNTPATSWDDKDNLAAGSSNYWNTSSFKLYDSFTYFAESKSTNNPLTKCAYLVTATGAPIPVFNSISDAVAYSVANNLYYTSSDYTGEGKEIIIPMDEIDKILNGYYNGMYDLLQQLIEQNGGNALTPEQLQELVDEVKASFGMIQDTIDKGFAQQDILIQKNSQILQNIADALNKFFSQSKESRTAFLKEFKDYAKDQQTRDDALYKLISDYIESTRNNNPDTSEPSLPPPPAPGDNTDTPDSSAWHEKLFDSIKKGFDDVVNGLQKGFSSVVDELKKIKHWTALDTLLDGAGAVGEWVSLLTDLLDPEKRLGTLTDFVGTAMDALNDTTNLVKGKFPFCIPVDILALMQTLSAEPQTPVFKIPFVIESWDIHAEVEIDLKDFDIISDISRTFLTILWCCALMNFTTKITDMKSI